MRLLITSLLLAFLSIVSSAQDKQMSYYDWVDKSAMFVDVNRLDSAAYSLQQAMKLEPTNRNNPMLLVNLGILQRQLRMLDDAFISLTAALALNPEPTLVLHNRASLLCDKNRYDEAMEDYTSIIKIDPENAEFCEV